MSKTKEPTAREVRLELAIVNLMLRVGRLEKGEVLPKVVSEPTYYAVLCYTRDTLRSREAKGEREAALRESAIDMICARIGNIESELGLEPGSGE